MHHRAPLEADILWRGRIQAVTEEESRAILASITEEEKRVFRSAFSEFDRNGDGSISTNVSDSHQLVMPTCVSYFRSLPRWCGLWDKTPRRPSCRTPLMRWGLRWGQLKSQCDTRSMWTAARRWSGGSSVSLCTGCCYVCLFVSWLFSGKWERRTLTTRSGRLFECLMQRAPDLSVRNIDKTFKISNKYSHQNVKFRRRGDAGHIPSVARAAFGWGAVC